ncbi:uncharacterized protein N7459_000896 [Penicillium hispanicum]|uniref:uncharacterized protein n=1 Tax=Penicillium hispanicum TaxID=1080232 RepID=UPI0025412F1C|nr:uncharacterized protein N7459_000896 [Penicillium hispanicum]KAJ5594688.1 hypothetical protein N7459_000896 [Penicillium hispanicum]
MPPTTLDQKASAELKKIATWVFETNELKEEQENIFRCVHEDRHAKGYGYSLCGVTGRSALQWNRKDYQSLFPPLSIQSEADSTVAKMQVAGEALSLGTYISFASPPDLNGPLDFLIVYLPEPRTPSDGK